MGLTCCLPIRDEDDHPTDDNSNASLSRNPLSFEFRHSIFNKIKRVFRRNEVHVTQPVQRREILNANSNLIHPNNVQNPPQVAVIRDKPAAFVNRPVGYEILAASSSPNHPNVEIEQNQPSEQNLEAGSVVIPEAAATSEIIAEILNTRSCHEASANMEKKFTDANGVFYEVFPSSDEEDVCPTCLEDYEPENPKIVAECSHHFHLSCIYDWLERSERCPICFRLMVINEN